MRKNNTAGTRAYVAPVPVTGTRYTIRNIKSS